MDIAAEQPGPLFQRGMQRYDANEGDLPGHKDQDGAFAVVDIHHDRMPGNVRKMVQAKGCLAGGGGDDAGGDLESGGAGTGLLTVITDLRGGCCVTGDLGETGPGGGWW